MVDMHSAHIQSKLKDIDDYIRQEYLDQHPKKERGWRTYEEQSTRRIYTAMRSLDPRSRVDTAHRAGMLATLTSLSRGSKCC